MAITITTLAIIFCMFAVACASVALLFETDSAPLAPSAPSAGGYFA
jgi:hypothetical protein